MTHVLDADAFHSAIDKTKEKITSQTEQIKQLETAVKGIVDLEDAFKGEGGRPSAFSMKSITSLSCRATLPFSHTIKQRSTA